jgi:hypothetical protein
MVDCQYVGGFEDLTKNINSGTAEAKNNLDFLNSLLEPSK